MPVLMKLYEACFIIKTMTLTVSVYTLDYFSSLKCSSTRIEYIRRGKPNSCLALLESESSGAYTNGNLYGIAEDIEKNFVTMLSKVPFFNEVARCQVGSDVEPIEAIEELGDLGIVGEDAQDFGDENFSPTLGVNTVCVFPKNSALVVPAGEETELLVGMKNDEESILNVIATKASIHLPFNHQLLVQSLAAQAFNIASVLASAQATYYPIKRLGMINFIIILILELFDFHLDKLSNLHAHIALGLYGKNGYSSFVHDLFDKMLMRDFISWMGTCTVLVNFKLPPLDVSIAFPQATPASVFPPCASNYFQLDDLLTPDEKAIKMKVKQCKEQEIAPIMTEYWEKAKFSFLVIPKLGALNMTGGTIKGYGCPGLSIT